MLLVSTAVIKKYRCEKHDKRRRENGLWEDVPAWRERVMGKRKQLMPAPEGIIDPPCSEVSTWETAMPLQHGCTE
jgi:hypothetical protein